MTFNPKDAIQTVISQWNTASPYFRAASIVRHEADNLAQEAESRFVERLREELREQR